MTIRALFQAKHAAVSDTVQFTAGKATIIDKFTANNTSTSAATLVVYLVEAGGAASPSNKQLSISIDAGKSYLCGELVGHVLETGDQIVTLAGTATAISIRASGRDVP